jgi:channel protein (hemolysin III family)
MQQESVGDPIELEKLSNYAILDSPAVGIQEGDEETRWHEGHQHDEEQHYHHLTLPSPADIETDDREFVDPTEKINRPTKFVLTTFERLPKFLADNEYIRSGYRVHFSFKLCIISLFRRHNETLNVWTHLLGAIMFTSLMIATYSYILPSIHKRAPIAMDYAVFAVFFFGAHAQMLFSAIYHLFSAHSASVAKWLARLDYMGICLMIVGSYYPPLYYMLRPCHPTLMRVHLTMISILGVIGIGVIGIPRLQGPRFRVFRAVFFLVFALYVIIPFPQIVSNLGFGYLWPLFWRLGIMGLLYIFGVAIYASRCPERCCPGKLDFGWYSHPIWHLFVIAAGLMQFYNCIYAYSNYLMHECPT